MSNKQTILVVDDEVDLREIIQMDLEDAGYRVLLAESGNAAIELLGHETVDLILSDMRMPNGSGIDLLDFVKANGSDVPSVLFVTGFTDVSSEELYARGAGAILSKPFELKELLEHVSRLLLSPSLRWKRKADRFDVKISVALKSANFSEAVSAGIINLGRGGMFVTLNFECPRVGESIEFSFLTGAGERIVGLGTVRWVRREKSGILLPGIGLEFLEISDDLMPALVDLLATLTSPAHIPLGE